MLKHPVQTKQSHSKHIHYADNGLILIYYLTTNEWKQ